MELERDLPHPATAELDLSQVYDALSDPTRRRVLLMLDQHGELNCSSFLEVASKTALSYHLARLRESGLVRTRVDGTRRIMALRRDDLERRFPGLLPAVLAAIRAEAAAPGKVKAKARPAVSRPRSPRPR
jgi:DNA-binding transcriptional ArsR family regulator